MTNLFAFDPDDPVMITKSTGSLSHVVRRCSQEPLHIRSGEETYMKIGRRLSWLLAREYILWQFLERVSWDIFANEDASTLPNSLRYQLDTESQMFPVIHPE